MATEDKAANEVKEVKGKIKEKIVLACPQF